MRGKRAQAERLRTIPLFSTCTTGQLRRIDSFMTHILAKAGQVLIREGCREGQFVVVLEGTASAFRDGTLIGQLEPGSFFGETALLDPMDGTPEVIADTDMELVVASRQEFRCLLGLIPAVSGDADVRQVRELSTPQPAARIRTHLEQLRCATAQPSPAEHSCH